MPVLGSTSYNSAGDVSRRLRTIVNDSEISGGDILTDDAPFTFEILNGAYERVQLELAKAGIEVSITYAWLIGLPIMPTVDAEARMVIDDTGCNILYPTGTGDVFAAAPQLPVDLVLPLDLFERQTGTTQLAGRLSQPAGGLRSADQQLTLCEWEWKADGIQTRGALQSQDLKIEYEKQLPKLVVPEDPVPIRGVVNAAAYFGALIYSESRGGAIAPQYKEHADEEIFLRLQVSSRRRQRMPSRRRPYSGRSRGFGR